MKTNRTNTMTTLLLSLVLVFSSGATFGQGRSDRGRSDRTSNSGTRIENKSVNYNIRNERSSYNYSRNRGNSSNTYEYTPPKNAKNNKNASSKYYMNSGHNTVKEHHHYHHKHATYSYHRPITYHTWHYPAPWAFAPNAIVFRHHHGDYFYHHGRFYRYHPVRGYYRVAAPRTVVFSHLPVGYEAVYVGSGLFYRYGEVFFEYTPYGYRIIPRPGGLVVTAKF